jgi:hypothetical protein
MSRDGRAAGGAMLSGVTAAMALFGMESYFAEAGSCTSTIPFAFLIAVMPREPSLPIPERMMPMLLSCRFSAREVKKVSIGSGVPCGSSRAKSRSVLCSNDMLLLGGMT